MTKSPCPVDPRHVEFAKAYARAHGVTVTERSAEARAAESAGCNRIVTRNVADYSGSRVLAVKPEEFVLDFDLGSSAPVRSG